MQRRKPRILAAIGLTAVLSLPVAAGASYIPDVLHLGPDTGHRFSDDQWDGTLEDLINRAQDAAKRPPSPEGQAVLDLIKSGVLDPYCPGGGCDDLHAPGTQHPECVDCTAWLHEEQGNQSGDEDGDGDVDETDAQMTLRQYFSLDWGW